MFYGFSHRQIVHDIFNWPVIAVKRAKWNLFVNIKVLFTLHIKLFHDIAIVYLPPLILGRASTSKFWG